MELGDRLLKEPRPEPESVLVTGATGFVGSLAVAAFLARTNAKVVAPVRPKHSDDKVKERVRQELLTLGSDADEADSQLSRLVILPLPAREDILELEPALRSHKVQRLVHCAGSVDYFNAELLMEVNVEFTRALIQLAKAADLEQFIFVSTAFSSGYTEVPIPEALHAEPEEEDPTEYTRSKRIAERDVAESGLPFLVLRPSIVSGHSQTGVYRGRPYGIYQFLNAADRLLLNRGLDGFTVVAPRRPLPVIHQDAFQQTLLAAMRYVPDSTIMNQVSRPESLPTMHDMMQMWLEQVVCFDEVVVYDRLDDVPMKDLSRRMRMWVEFSAVNTEIATHTWDFQIPTLEALRARQIVPENDASCETLRRCVRTWQRNSDRFQTHLKAWKGEPRIPTIRSPQT